MVLLVATLLLLFVSIRGVGSWLLVADQMPPRLDVIFTFAGDGRRVSYSKELMLRFKSAHWLLSDYKNGHSRLLKKSNFDMTRVTTVDTCKSTISEITMLGNWLDFQYALQFRTGETADTTHRYVGLVSSPYHMRRIKMMLREVKGDPAVNYFLLPVPLEVYQWSVDSYRYWWRYDYIAKYVFSELQKIGYFLLTGYHP